MFRGRLFSESEGNSLLWPSASPIIKKVNCERCKGTKVRYNEETGRDETCDECDGDGYLEIET